MVCRLKLIVPVLGLLLLIGPSSAFAEEEDMVQSKLFSETLDQIDKTKQEEAGHADAQAKELMDKIEEGNNTIIQALGTPAPEEPSHPDQYRAAAAMGLPGALVAQDAMLNTVLFNRLRELNGISPQQVGQKIADYLVDPQLKRKSDGGPILIGPQIFRIFMTSFCDPNGRGGTMRSLTNIESKDNPGYEVGCGAWLKSGSPTTDPAYPSRYTYFGADLALGVNPTTVKDYQRQDIVNLPLRPNRLFFDPLTYPIDSKDMSADTTNTNPMAPYYYGAFAQALEFLTGFPQDQRNTGGLANSSTDQQAFLNKQRDITRQMLAGYPFALLFSERVGSLDQAATSATAHMLIDKIGPMSADDDVLYNHVQNLLQRQTLSKAEYDDIMYQILMSPGYLARISKLKGRDIEAEKVWLTAMQTALNYQRNRWLEILAALEAVR